jgi:hypothetical protein
VRVFLFALIAVVSQTAAQAQVKNDAKDNAKDNAPPPCFYSIGGKSIDVAVGKSVCRRSPAPYQDQYALLRCGPPLDEIALVKRGDPRCDRYEDRQQE